jgi:hypothetical protein
MGNSMILSIYSGQFHPQVVENMLIRITILSARVPSDNGSRVRVGELQRWRMP